MVFDGGGGGGGLDRQLTVAGLSKHESKACYWTEGVPSVKKTGSGSQSQKTAAEMVAAAVVAAVVAS